MHTVGLNAYYDAHLKGIKRFLNAGILHEGGARAFAQTLGLGLEAAALHWSAPAPVFEAFSVQRLDPARRGFLYGDLSGAVDKAWLIERACSSLGLPVSGLMGSAGGAAGNRPR